MKETKKLKKLKNPLQMNKDVKMSKTQKNKSKDKIKIIMAQFANIKPNSKILNKYLNNAFKGQHIDLVIFGEYCANLFFKEYDLKRDKIQIQKNFLLMQEYFKNLAIKFKTIIIVPLIEFRENKIFKSIMISQPSKTIFYQSKKLMEMEHWNERNFFDNDLSKKDFNVFKIGEFNVSVLFGFESHFDEFWIQMKKKNVDIVVVPTSSTFNSSSRWEHLIQSKSFVNNCFVIRVNRVGKYVENNINWEFYGNSFIALPDGNIGDMLGDKEGILISEIKKNTLNEALKNWGFR